MSSDRRDPVSSENGRLVISGGGGSTGITSFRRTYINGKKSLVPYVDSITISNAGDHFITGIARLIFGISGAAFSDSAFRAFKASSKFFKVCSQRIIAGVISLPTVL